jgi:hypothetical protein
MFQLVKKQRVKLIDFHPIPIVDLAQLVHKMSAYDWKTPDAWPGHVRLNVSVGGLVGVGAFKTAQSAHLMLLPLRSAGLGSLPNQPIVIKQSYIHSYSSHSS